MAVAWIGNRETQFERAVEEAAALLDASRCPVITFDTDIHGARAAIALAERIGAAYDIADGGATAREAALITDKGAMTIAPGEARRRADVLVVVGPVPDPYAAWLGDLAGRVTDLSAGQPRKVFTIGSGKGLSLGEDAVPVSAARLDVAATLAALRAHLNGRQTAIAPKNLEGFASALGAAVFPVFLYSGLGLDVLALEMLQGLVADLNKTKRASSLHLPASESGWGSVLASAWMTGFPPRTSFARGYPEFDPWRFNVARMIAAGEADVHVKIGGESEGRAPIGEVALISLRATQKPVPNAAVTLVIGVGGVDHDAVVYSTGLGTIAATQATKPPDRPSAAKVVGAIRAQLGQEVLAPTHEAVAS